MVPCPDLLREERFGANMPRPRGSPWALACASWCLCCGLTARGSPPWEARKLLDVWRTLVLQKALTELFTCCASLVLVS